ncbi:SRPBCC family protein [Kribbella sp. ALI-6-A]|uniref:SRPBCC family protein n=1 Tax=Kribbella sp. ALI-6-A TaxID=1933817 RepID=UPI000A041EFA|nr:SRPBCC family protein [Kribbella sp. ALI-6-A]
MTTPEQSPPPVVWSKRIPALLIVTATAVLAPLLLVRAGRLDTAALFVGAPLAIAVVIALAPPAKSLHGLTFRVVTFALMITSAFLHEGAACVLMAAPLVYGVAHFVAEIVRQSRLRREGDRYLAALAIVPLLAAGLEGTAYRVDPIQQVSVERVVAMSPVETVTRLARGPDFSAERPFLLRLTGYPTPTTASGTGLEVGTRWSFLLAGDPIVTEVVAHDQRRIAFAVVEDQSKTQRWLHWQGGSIQLTPRADGTTEVDLTVEFTRRLDPSWYFGPIEAAMVGAGLDHFADSLGLTAGARPTD